MTTVVVDRKKRIMASDRQTTYGGLRIRSDPKIKRLRDKDAGECLIATSGPSEAGVAFEYWMREQFTGKPQPGKDEVDRPCSYPLDADLAAIVLHQNGQCLLYLGKGIPIEIKDRYFGIGSGSEYALGALHSGADIQAAVRIASKLDNGTGRGIQVEGFNNA